MPEIPLKPEDQRLLQVENLPILIGNNHQQINARIRGNNKTRRSCHYPSVQEIQAIRDEAYNEGFQSGYSDGLAQGKQEGKQQGLELGTQEGKEQGVQQGRKEGEEQAKQQAAERYQQELAKATQAWQTAITALQSTIESRDSELQPALVQMVVQICRGVFIKEMQLSPDHIQAIVQTALAAFPQMLNAFNFLNADDHAELEALTNYQPEQDIQCVVDDSLASGGCIVKSQYSYVDYTMTHRFTQQLQSVIEALPELDWPALTDVSVALNSKEVELEHAQPAHAAHTDNSKQQNVNSIALDDGIDSAIHNHSTVRYKQHQDFSGAVHLVAARSSPRCMQPVSHAADSQYASNR